MGDDQSNDEADWKRWAEADALDIMKADSFVAFTEAPGTMSRGGRHVEWGLALTVVKGVKRTPGWMLRIGPCESQFYALADLSADSALEMRESIGKLTAPFVFP